MVEMSPHNHIFFGIFTGNHSQYIPHGKFLMYFLFQFSYGIRMHFQASFFLTFFTVSIKKLEIAVSQRRYSHPLQQRNNIFRSHTRTVKPRLTPLQFITSQKIDSSFGRGTVNCIQGPLNRKLGKSNVSNQQ